MRKEYYEAIIQLRPAREEVVGFVLKQISERQGVFISKVVELKTGLDLYMSSQKLALDIGRRLKRRFKGAIKITRSLYGINRQTSKKVYRVTLCYREKSL